MWWPFKRRPKIKAPPLNLAAAEAGPGPEYLTPENVHAAVMAAFTTGQAHVMNAGDAKPKRMVDRPLRPMSASPDYTSPSVIDQTVGFTTLSELMETFTSSTSSDATSSQSPSFGGDGGSFGGGGSSATWDLPSSPSGDSGGGSPDSSTGSSDNS